MKIDIQETINHLRELDQKASPTPWNYNPWSSDSNGGITQNITFGWGEEEEILLGEVSFLLTEHDAELIAESRNAIPVLLAEIERLTAQNKNLEEAWEDGYADAICDVEGTYKFDRAELTTTPNPYKENNK